MSATDIVWIIDGVGLVLALAVTLYYTRQTKDDS